MEPLCSGILTSGKEPLYSLDKILSEPQRRSGYRGDEKIHSHDGNEEILNTFIQILKFYRSDKYFRNTCKHFSSVHSYYLRVVLGP